ncbi:hypothetical protein ABK040_007578 [Willaertia magna]
MNENDEQQQQQQTTPKIIEEEEIKIEEEDGHHRISSTQNHKQTIWESEFNENWNTTNNNNNSNNKNEQQQEPTRLSNSSALHAKVSGKKTKKKKKRGKKFIALEDEEESEDEQEGDEEVEEEQGLSHVSSEDSLKNVSSSQNLLSESDSFKDEHRLHSQIIKNTVRMEEILQIEKMDKRYGRKVMVFLTIIGMICGFVNFLHEIIIKYMVQGKFDILDSVDPGRQDHKRGIFAWMAYDCSFVLFGLTLIAWIAPAAEGSGLVAIKAILNGVDSLKETALHYKVLLVKLLTLPFGVATGLFIGKMGPEIHLGCMFTYHLLKTRFFKDLRKHKQLTNQLLTCGVAIGSAVNDGAVVGGVLLALELFGNYNKRIWLKSFYGAIIGVLTHRLLRALREWTITPFVPWKIIKIDFTQGQPYILSELLSYTILSIIMAFAGVGFVYLNEKVFLLRDKFGKKHFGFFNLDTPSPNQNHPNRFVRLLYTMKSKLLIFCEFKMLWAFLICLTTFVVTYPNFFGKFMSLGGMPVIEELMMQKPMMSENGAKGEWIKSKDTDAIVSIAIFLAARIPLVLLTTIVPIAGGTYLQLLVIGSAFGRLYGECLYFVFSRVSDTVIYPGTYAIIGAIALSCSVTQALSSMLIVIEIAGAELQLPSMIACVIGFTISRWLSYSTYDSAIKLKRLPMLLEMQTDSEEIKVSQVMTPIEKLIYFVEDETITYSDIQQLLEMLSKPREDGKQWPKLLGVVTNRETMLLKGYVQVSQLKRMMELKEKAMALEQQSEVVIEVPKEQNDSIHNAAVTTTVEIVDSSDTNDTKSDVTSSSITKQPHKDSVRLPINTVPISVSENIAAIFAYMMFSNMDTDELFIVAKGKLVGQLQKYALVGVITDRKKIINNV